jgi:hypothetical protein
MHLTSFIQNKAWLIKKVTFWLEQNRLPIGRWSRPSMIGSDLQNHFLAFLKWRWGCGAQIELSNRDNCVEGLKYEDGALRKFRPVFHRFCKRVGHFVPISGYVGEQMSFTTG